MSSRSISNSTHYDSFYTQDSLISELSKALFNETTKLRITSKIVFDENKTRNLTLNEDETLLYLKIVKITVVKNMQFCPAWMINTVNTSGNELTPGTKDYEFTMRLAERVFKENIQKYDIMTD